MATDYDRKDFGIFLTSRSEDIDCLVVDYLAVDFRSVLLNQMRNGLKIKWPVVT